MPVYNAEKYLKMAIESILFQTYQNIELIIIDDCSIDNSKKIILEYEDSRIKIISNHDNLGISVSLNKGINASTGKYIARMDADDISLPDRIKTQIEFMERYPKIGLLGTGYYLIDDKGRRKKKYTYPSENLDLRWRLLSGPIFPHPTVMIRKDLLISKRLRYNENLECAQDYELWTKLLPFTNASNLDEALIEYRQHKGTVSSSKFMMQENTRYLISANVLSQLNGESLVSLNRAKIFEKVAKSKLKSLDVVELEHGFTLFEIVLNKFYIINQDSKKLLTWKNQILRNYFDHFIKYLDMSIFNTIQKQKINYFRLLILKIIKKCIKFILVKKKNILPNKLLKSIHTFTTRIIYSFD